MGSVSSGRKLQWTSGDRTCGDAAVAGRSKGHAVAVVSQRGEAQQVHRLWRVLVVGEALHLRGGKEINE